jgi:hypothetical protein
MTPTIGAAHAGDGAGQDRWATAWPYSRAVSIMRRRLVKDPIAKRFPIGPEALRLAQEGNARVKDTLT